MASEGQYDLRSRIERNSDAQGLIRSHLGSGREGSESVVWLSLDRRGWRDHSIKPDRRRMVKVTIPSSLTTHSPSREKRGGSRSAIDLDDDFFAHRLRDRYRNLSGSWFRRAFSAKKPRVIRLGQVSPWSGNTSSDSHSRPSRSLLGGTVAHVADVVAAGAVSGCGGLEVYRGRAGGVSAEARRCLIYAQCR